MADFVDDVQGHTPDQIPAVRASSLLADAATVYTLLRC